jgi:hypothetical protein
VDEGPSAHAPDSAGPAEGRRRGLGLRLRALAGRASVPGLVVAAVVAFTAWELRSELHPVAYLNDSSFHRTYLGWATDRLASGDNPLDGIFTAIGPGFPLFQHYQVLPYLLMAPVAWLFGVESTYVGSFYLLLVLWPVCVYAAARLMELDRWAAAGAAVVAPFVMSASGYGFEVGSYVWRGYGMWTQAWGMWFFALGLACAWRAIFRGRSLALAALLLAMALTSHLLTGLLALAVVGAWGLVGPRPWRRSLVRAAAIGGGALLASAWLLVPSLLDRGATYYDNPAGTEWSDSYGVRRVLSWLWRGHLFDQGRWPVITLLGAVGLAVVLWRALREADDRARAVLVLGVVSLALFFGATVVGPVVDRLPGREVLFLHRMIVGVHFGGVLLAGWGAAAAGRAVVRGARRWGAGRLPSSVPQRAVAVAGAGALVVVGVVGLAPAWSQMQGYVDQQAEWLGVQRAAEGSDGRDFATLVGIAAAEGGRVSAGTRGSGWADSYRIGHVPAYIALLDLGVDGIGFTGRVPSLTEPSEAAYTGEVVGQSDAFDVRWHLRPVAMAGPAGGELVATRGRHNLWRVPTSGPVRMVDTTPALAADRSDVATVSSEFFTSSMPHDGRYPVLALGGAAPVDPTLAPGASGRAGAVRSVRVDPGGGSYRATVAARRPAALLVKVSYHPRWSARVDGEPAAVFPVAPGLLAVAVPAGRHTVVVRYAGVPVALRLGLLAAGAAGLVALAMVDRRGGVLRRRGRRGGAGVGAGAVAGAGGLGVGGGAGES